MNNGFSVVNHVGITVSNLEKSIEFYETLTGKKISNKDEMVGNVWLKLKVWMIL